MATPFFVANAASVTVMRPLASSAFGTYALGLPEGVDLEDVYTLQAPGNQLGHVSQLTAHRRVGGLARRFVRADVAVTAVDTENEGVESSDVDAVLEEAADRVAGDFFLETDISLAGLGSWVPLVDFEVGDRARVEVFGHVVVLPVTRIEQIISEHQVVDWLVHVGGQLVSDEDARLVENAALQRALVQDRRELAGLDGAVSRVAVKAAAAVEAASSAQTTAEGAETKAKDAEKAAEGAVEAQQVLAEVTTREQFILHDNQLKWLAWTKPFFDFLFSPESGASTRVRAGFDSGLIDVRVNTQSGMGVEVITRPGWRGAWRLEWTQAGGTASGDVIGYEDGTARSATSRAYQTDMVIRHIRLNISPEYTPAPREWVVRIASREDGGPVFVAPDMSLGQLTISGAPTQQASGAVRFEMPVIASSDVLANGVLVASGAEIPARQNVLPVADETAGLVLFTEMQPALTWEPGAPLSGRHIVPIASQTIPQSTWVTLASWTGLAWSSPRTARVEFTVNWAKYNSWAFADYYTRVTLNGAQIGSITRSTTGGMDMQFKIEITGRTLRAGDVLRFEARATPGYASERKIASALADIRW